MFYIRTQQRLFKPLSALHPGNTNSTHTVRSRNDGTRESDNNGISPVSIGMDSTPFKTIKPTPKEVTEVRIPVPWGHIAGKWWGAGNIQPIIGLHGWQDNAGTWDRLAPYLPPDTALLAIDLPGHGRSSHFQPGCGYHFLEYVASVRRIVHYYNWQVVSFLSHSLGSIIAYAYSSLYQAAVENYIAIDAMQFFTYKPQSCADNWGRFIDQLIKIDHYDDSMTPTYTYEEAVERLMSGSRGWLTRDSCDYLLERGLEETAAGYYRFTRDPRVRIGQLQLVSLSPETSRVFSSCLRCSVLNITATAGLVYDTSEAYETVKRAAKRYQHHVVEGTHQLQLNNPEKVAPIINDFLNARQVAVNK